MLTLVSIVTNIAIDLKLLAISFHGHGYLLARLFGCILLTFKFMSVYGCFKHCLPLYLHDLQFGQLLANYLEQTLSKCFAIFYQTF